LAEIELDSKSDHDLLVILVTKMNVHEEMFHKWDERISNVCVLADRTHIALQVLQKEHEAIMESGGHEPSQRYTRKQLVASGVGSASAVAVLYGVVRAILAHYGIVI